MRTPAQIVVVAAALPVAASLLAAGEVSWVRRSSATGDLAAPNGGSQQTCLVVADFDRDGIADFAIGERTRTPSVVWYRWDGAEWERRVVDDSPLEPEAGGDAGDLDGDGDPDLILGQDASGSAIWWWENPCPEFDRPWTRRLVKDSGGRKHHDQTLGDYDGDGRAELVSWNQGAKQLLLFEIPPDPRASGVWTAAAIDSWDSGQELEGFPSLPADIDGDGRVDILVKPYNHSAPRVDVLLNLPGGGG